MPRMIDQTILTTTTNAATRARPPSARSRSGSPSRLRRRHPAGRRNQTKPAAMIATEIRNRTTRIIAPHFDPSARDVSATSVRDAVPAARAPAFSRSRLAPAPASLPAVFRTSLSAAATSALAPQPRFAPAPPRCRHRPAHPPGGPAPNCRRAGRAARRFIERCRPMPANLVRVRPVDAPAGDDTAAVLARIEVWRPPKPMSPRRSTTSKNCRKRRGRRRKPGSRKCRRARPRARVAHAGRRYVAALRSVEVRAQ